MKLKPPFLSIYLSRFCVAVACVTILGCATPSEQPRDPRFAVAEKSLDEARSAAPPTEQRIAYYLQAAANSAPRQGRAPTRSGTHEL